MADLEVGLLTVELRDVRLRFEDESEDAVKVRVDAVLGEHLRCINAAADRFSSAVATLQKSEEGAFSGALEGHDRALVELTRQNIAAVANSAVQFELRRTGEGAAGDVLLATGSVQMHEVLTAPNVNILKRVMLQAHESSAVKISDGSYIECQIFADIELANFVLGGDFHRCVSIDVFGVLQSWLSAAAPQPPIIEQKFFVELELQSQQENSEQEHGVETEGDETGDNTLWMNMPSAGGQLIIPEDGSDTEAASRIHFDTAAYSFAHRDDVTAMQALPTLGIARFRLKHVLYSSPDGGDKKKGKKSDAPPVETATYYSAAFDPTTQQFDSQEVSFELTLKAEEKSDEQSAEEAKLEADEATQEAIAQPIQAKIVYSTTQIWSKPAEKIGFSKSLSEILPTSSRSRPQNPPRDVDQELRFELKEIISMVASEYTKLFAQNGKLDKDEKKAKLLHHLSVSGIYHSFKEKLKPRVTRVARHKFGPKQRALEATTAADAGEPELELDEFLSKLYLHLLNESTTVLNAVYQDTVVELEECDVYDGVTTSEERETCHQKLARLKRWAADAEANGQFDVAVKWLMDRVNFALDDQKNDPELERVSKTWVELAELHLRLKTETSLESAQACLTEAVSASAMQNNLLLLGSCLLEQGQHEKASICFHPSNWAQQSEEYQISALNPMFHVARCLYFHACNDAARAGGALQAAVKAHLAQRLQPEMHEQGRPRRTAVCVLLQAAHKYATLNCFNLARQAFDLAEQAEDACRVKAHARNILVETPAFHQQLMRRVQALLAAQSVEVDSKIVVETLLREALLFDVNANANTECWVELGDFLFAMGDKQQSLEAYKKAMNIHNGKNEGPSTSPLPLATYFRAGVMLLEFSDYDSAQAVFMSGCTEHNSALLWLGAAVSFLRQEAWKDAEQAIMEASRLDYTSPEVWGFFALLCLCSSSSRETEAQQSIAQACRLGLTDAGLLKELALENIAVGKLQTAEDLLRRALAVAGNTKTALTYSQSASRAMLRKQLGDCLSGQNRAADAIGEYQKVACDPNATQDEQTEALAKCIPLLTTLGREEELESVEQSLQMLQSVTPAPSTQI